MGFWDELGEGLVEGLKIGGKIIVSGAAATAIVATAGTAAPIVAPLAGAGIICLGKGVKEAAKDCDNEFLNTWVKLSSIRVLAP